LPLANASLVQEQFPLTRFVAQMLLESDLEASRSGTRTGIALTLRL